MKSFPFSNTAAIAAILLASFILVPLGSGQVESGPPIRLKDPFNPPPASSPCPTYISYVSGVFSAGCQTSCQLEQGQAVPCLMNQSIRIEVFGESILEPDFESFTYTVYSCRCTGATGNPPVPGNLGCYGGLEQIVDADDGSLVQTVTCNGSGCTSCGNTTPQTSPTVLCQCL